MTRVGYPAEWYLIRSFLALSARSAARPASFSSIFLFFHCINSSGVMGVVVFNFARWSKEKMNHLQKAKMSVETSKERRF